MQQFAETKEQLATTFIPQVLISISRILGAIASLKYKDIAFRLNLLVTG